MQSKILLLPIAITIFLSPLFSFGQNTFKPSDVSTLHHEVQGDPYLPNAYNNKKTSPAYKYKSKAVSKMATNSSIFTNQVNVDAAGQNIIGDAANEPSIAVNPLNGNEIAIGWRQFDNVSSNFRQAGWGYTTDAGQTWIFPGVLEPGIFRSDPVLDYDSSGNFYYNSLTITPDYLCKVFLSTDGGVTWDTGTDAQGGDKQWMAIDRTQGVGSGNIYSFWTSWYSSCLPEHFTRSTDGGNSYEPCISVDGEPRLGTMAIGNAGELFIAGSATPDSIVVSKSLNAQNPGSVISWNPPAFVFLDGFIAGHIINPAGLLGQANIDVDISNGPGQGNVYVCAAVGRYSVFDAVDIMFAKSTDGGLTWNGLTRINDDTSLTNTQWFGTMSVAPDGRIDIAWLDTRDNPGSDSSALYYSYSIDQGVTWSANEKLSGSFDPHVGYPNQDKMGDYFDMVSDNSGAHLAWANTLNGEQDVYYSHIVPPVASAVNDNVANITISIFPVPTNGTLVIATNAKQSRVEICNVMGETVYQESNLKSKTNIDISFLPAGIYLLKISGRDTNTLVKKIIRE